MKSCDTQRLRLLRHGFSIFFARVALVKACARVWKIFFQKNKNWCRKLADLDVSNTIQSQEYSRDSGADGFLHESVGVLRAVNVNWNDDGWNVNANSVENPNKWNAGNQVFSRNYCFSPVLLAGVFFFLSISPFLQAPSWRPISSNFLESSTYFPVGISLFSQANCAKNFKISRREIIFPNSIIFWSGGI